MPAIDDEDRPKKKIVHEIGQDLTLLSVEGADERSRCCRKKSRASKPTWQEAGVSVGGRPVLQEVAACHNVYRA